MLNSLKTKKILQNESNKRKKKILYQIKFSFYETFSTCPNLGIELKKNCFNYYIKFLFHIRCLVCKKNYSNIVPFFPKIIFLCLNI
jgi:hypothetical protein